MLNFRNCPVQLAFALALLSPLSLWGQPRVLDATLIEFEIRVLRDRGNVKCFVAKDFIRIEQPSRKMAIIYHKPTQTFIGLNLRDGLWWSFSWKDIAASIKNTERYKDRLYDLSVQGFARYNEDLPTGTSNIEEATAFTWRPLEGDSGEKRTEKVSGFSCERWSGEGTAGVDAEAAVTTQRIERFTQVLREVRDINEQLAVTTGVAAVPAIYFVITDSLARAAVTPIEVEWQGLDDRQANQVRLRRIGRATLDPRKLQPPQSYRRVDLYTLKGIIPNQRELDPAPTNIAR